MRFSYKWPGDQEPSYYTIAHEKGGTGEARLLATWSKLARDGEKYGEPLRHFLRKEVTKHLRERLFVDLPEHGGVELRPNSLLGAMYVLLAEDLTGEWPRNVCKACGRSFVPAARRHQATCSGACRKRWSRRQTERS